MKIAAAHTKGTTVTRGQRKAALMGGDGVFRIVAGLDGSAESRLAFEWAVSEARLRDGQVQAVTAWTYPPVTVGMEGMIFDPEIFPQAARRVQTDLLKRVDSTGVTVSAEVIEGPAARVLLRASEEADLLVVGSRGLGGFTGLLLGSVSTQVVHHSACPVLVVRTRPRAKAGNQQGHVPE